MSIINNEMLKKFTKTRENILKKKKEHTEFYNDILVFVKNKDCSESIKERIKVFMKISCRKMSVFSNENCFLVGIKKKDYYDFIKSNKFEKYFEIETFNNDSFMDKDIKIKQQQESFMKIKPISRYDIDYVQKTQAYMKHYKNIICILVEPSEEEKTLIPFWHTYYISSNGIQGPFKYGQENYSF